MLVLSQNFIFFFMGKSWAISSQPIPSVMCAGKLRGDEGKITRQFTRD